MLLVYSIIFLSTQFAGINAAKILLVPGNGNSHILMFSRLGEELGFLGNQVELLIPSSSKMSKLKTNENYTITTYKVAEEVAFGDTKEVAGAAVDIALTSSVWDRNKKFETLMIDWTKALDLDCVSLMDNQILVNRLMKSDFQLAILDPFSAVECYYSLPMKLSIRYAYFSFNYLQNVYRVPHLPSFVPVLGTGYTDSMTFSERLATFMQECLFNINIWANDNSKYFADKYGHALTSFHGTIQNASLWFLLDDIATGFPRPGMPNTVSIGDLMARDPKEPLPKDLEDFLNGSPEKSILVSFGTHFDYVPEYLANGFCDVFRQLKYQVVWKLKNETYCNNVKNVKVVNWIPQNELLAHNKIQLFITHGGANSILESVYHAKPMIIFPLWADQWDNAAAVTSKGYGIQMSISDFNVEDLLRNIENILKDQTFTDNVHKGSFIMRDKPNSAAERASYLINHVVKHGDQHLRTGAYNLTLIQYFMFDIFIFITFSVTAFCFVMLCLLKFIFRLVLNSIRNTLSSKEKTI